LRKLAVRMKRSKAIMVVSGRSRTVRALFVLACVGTILAGVILLEPGSVRPGGVALIVTSAALPYLAYLAWVRTAVGTTLAGLALLAAAVGVQLYVNGRWEAGSSTAVVGYLYLPLTGFLIVGATVLVETVWPTRTGRSDFQEL
jgi:hypothetical protein